MESTEHTTSLAVWGLDGPITAGTTFSASIGAKCHQGCALTGQEVVVLDSAGRPAGEGKLGDQSWSGTANLYWCTVALVAPATAGPHRWTARFAPTGGSPVHREAQHGFGIASIPIPEHQLTVELQDKAKSTGLAQAHVRVGPYSATTDDQGRAILHVAAGDHLIQAWTPLFFAREERVRVEADATVRLTTELIPDKDPQYNRDWV